MTTDVKTPQIVFSNNVASVDDLVAILSSTILHAMNTIRGLVALSLVLFITSCGRGHGDSPHGTATQTNIQTFAVKGIIKELKADGKTAVIQHETIAGYMEAMTMPFHARDTNVLKGLEAGDQVGFRLSVADDASWIEQVVRLGRAENSVITNAAAVSSPNSPNLPGVNIVDGLAAFAFTNEFGQPVTFGDFKGQALGLTFFFTRCPLPEYCPRLTKNFASATRKLQALPNAPTNWHFFSISFDPQIDSPAVLRAYAKGYGYDSNRWTFLTSSQQTIDEVARRFSFNFKKEGGVFTHHFFTLVLDANGYWHAGWPVGGDTSDNLVEEIVKASAAVGK